MKYAGWVILGVFLLLGMTGCSTYFGTYNGLASKNQAVDHAIADVQIDTQRNYVVLNEVIQNANASARFERGTLDDITHNRSMAGGVINMDPSRIASDPQLQQQLFQAQQGLSATLGRLMVVMERYPDLQTTALYRRIHDTMEGSQNRIAHTRQVWNQATNDYNVAVTQIPGAWIVGMTPFPRHRDFYQPAGGPAPDLPALPYDTTVPAPANP